MKNVNSTLLIVILWLSGCDIPGKLIIENKSGKDAIYRCEFVEKDSIYEIKLKGEKGKNRSGLFFGFGHNWTDTTIKKYVSAIHKIEIFSISDSIVLWNKEEMYLFFRARRKGFFKDKIEIIIR